MVHRLDNHKLRPKHQGLTLIFAHLATPHGHAWTSETLVAYLDAHDIRPEHVPDLSHLKPWNEGRPWTDPDRILRAIERGPDETQDESRGLIKDDPEVR